MSADEYRLLRAELIAYENSRVTAVSIAATGTGIVLSIAAAQDDPFRRGSVALLALAVIWPPMFLIASRMRGVARITSYMRVFIEPNSKDYSWETRLVEMRRKSPKQDLIQGMLYRPRSDVGGWGGSRDIGVLLVIALIACALAMLSYLQAIVNQSDNVAWYGLGVALLLALFTTFFGPKIAGMTPLSTMQDKFVLEWESVMKAEQTSTKAGIEIDLMPSDPISRTQST